MYIYQHVEGTNYLYLQTEVGSPKYLQLLILHQAILRKVQEVSGF
jgi:hypothetical protein